MTDRPPLELVVDLYAVVYRNDDPRPARHPLGRLRLTDDDRYRWRTVLADTFANVAQGVRDADHFAGTDVEETT